MGGHHIPAEVIERRYARSAQNFRNLYLPLVDKWSVFDNSDVHSAKIIAEAENNLVSIYEESIWNNINSI